jgi:uroporphyrinogen-III synthase
MAAQCAQRGIGDQAREEYDAAMAVTNPITHRSPLAGATVVVTRPAASAAPIRRRVRQLGGNVLSLPGTTLKKTDDTIATKAALLAARSSDVVIFVSPAAVKYTFALARLRFSRTTQVCAMGEATARALRRRGVKQILIPHDEQTSEGLFALPQLQRLRGKRVVIVGAPGGRDLLANTLKSRKARVQSVHVYRRMPPRFRRDQLDAIEVADAPLITLITSEEILENLRAVLPLPLFGKLAAGELVVSSLRLAMAAQRSLFGSVHVAMSPAPADLLRAACGALAHHRL